MLSVSLLLTVFALLTHSKDIDVGTDTYDFVIVGGGTAGCVLARRLSDNGNHTVLLLEAGGIPIPALDVPSASPGLMRDPGHAAIFKITPQEKALLGTNGITDYIVARTLGGASSINGMVWNRGSPMDYDNWAAVTGDEGWSYVGMLPYLKRSENYSGDFPSAEQHGFGGPITVSRPKYSPGLEEWKQAGEELGFGYHDPNGPQKIGFTPDELSQKFGRRVSSYKGYLKPVMDSRSNLKVILGATVKKIMLTGNRAEGVTYVLKNLGETHLVKARKEVILSAGVMGSPMLLMKAGIGPREVLEKAGIPVVKHLPVGENLQDHVEFKLGFIINNRSRVHIAERDLNEENLRIYNETGDGPYTSFSAQVGQAFFASSMSRNKLWADGRLEYLSTPGIPSIFPAQKDVTLGENEVFTTCRVTVGVPKSRGSVTLNTTDLEGAPLIDFRYFSNPDDMQLLLEGIDLAFKIFETSPFKKLGARYPENPLPACRQLKFRSEDYWRCYIAQMTGSGLHGAGTCSMGRGPNDPNAVVDTKLKVIGIEGLRVTDASVMPGVTNANIQAPVYAIAEKASELILKEWLAR